MNQATAFPTSFPALTVLFIFICRVFGLCVRRANLLVFAKRRAGRRMLSRQCRPVAPLECRSRQEGRSFGALVLFWCRGCVCHFACLQTLLPRVVVYTKIRRSESGRVLVVHSQFLLRRIGVWRPLPSERIDAITLALVVGLTFCGGCCMIFYISNPFIRRRVYGRSQPSIHYA